MNDSMARYLKAVESCVDIIDKVNDEINEKNFMDTVVMLTAFEIVIDSFKTALMRHDTDNQTEMHLDFMNMSSDIKRAIKTETKLTNVEVANERI
jgi:hypothetical protein